MHAPVYINKPVCLVLFLSTQTSSEKKKKNVRMISILPEAPCLFTQRYLMIGHLLIQVARPVNRAFSQTVGPSRCLALCWGIEQLNGTLEDQKRLQMHLVTCQGLPLHTIWPVLFPLSGRRTSAGSSDGR